MAALAPYPTKLPLSSPAFVCYDDIRDAPPSGRKDQRRQEKKGITVNRALAWLLEPDHPAIAYWERRPPLPRHAPGWRDPSLGLAPCYRPAVLLSSYRPGGKRAGSGTFCPRLFCQRLLRARIRLRRRLRGFMLCAGGARLGQSARRGSPALPVRGLPVSQPGGGLLPVSPAQAEAAAQGLLYGQTPCRCWRNDANGASCRRRGPAR